MSDDGRKLPDPSRGVRLRRKVVATGVALVVLAALCGIGWFLAARVIPGIRFMGRFKKFSLETLANEQKIQKEWLETFGTEAEFHARHPIVETNETALRLDGLLAHLGLGAISPKAATSQEPMLQGFDDYSKAAGTGEIPFVRYQPPTESPEQRAARREQDQRISDLFKAADHYLQSNLDRSNPEVLPLPAELDEFITRHRAPLGEIARILTEEDPRWASHPGRSSYSEIVGLLTAMRAGKLLACAALSDLAGGGSVSAVYRLGAIRVLAERLASRGTQVELLVAMAMDRYVVAIARKLHGNAVLPGQLIANQGDRRVQLRDALAAEIYGFELVIQPDIAPTSRRRRWWSLTPRETPEMIHVWVLDSRRIMTALYRLNEPLDPCVGARKGVALPEEPAISDQSLFAAIVIPNIRSAFWRVSRLRVETEAAEKATLARSQIVNGRFPQTIPGIESSICSDARWNYEVDATGETATLRMTPPLDWPKNLKGIKPPSEIILRSAPTAHTAPIR